METVMRTAETESLVVAYEQTGPDAGEAILLLHGWPYGVRTYDGVRDRIANEGRRVVVPELRGFGETRYRSAEVVRSGQQAALGKDVVDLMDALGIERATLVGYDWGGRGACVAAALWPDRVKALVACGGYTVQDLAGAGEPKEVEQERQLWYQWYFQQERGRAGLEANRAALAEVLWRTWSPEWDFSEELFAETARGFENPDFVATTIQSYRHRYGNAAGDPALEGLEERLSERPAIGCPTIVLHGGNDAVTPARGSEGQEGRFTGRYERRVVRGVGHCVPGESPGVVAEAVEGVLRG